MYIVQQGSGSLQNVYKEVVHCKWVLPLQSTSHCISLHCQTFKVVVHTLWHCTAKRVQGGGSLQVSASAQEQLSPTSRSFFSPTNQFFVILITCTVITGGPRVFHTKISPHLLSDKVQTSSHGKKSFASPSNRVLSDFWQRIHCCCYGLIALNYGHYTTLKCQD